MDLFFTYRLKKIQWQISILCKGVNKAMREETLKLILLSKQDISVMAWTSYTKTRSADNRGPLTLEIDYEINTS